MRKVFLSVLAAAGIVAAIAAPAAAQDTATAIRLKALNIDCSSSVGTASFTVKIGGTTVGTFPFSQGCACNSAPLTATITDPSALALVSVPACTLVSVTTNDPQGGAYVGYVAVEIDRAVTGTEAICVDDFAGFVSGGGNCAPRDACTGYQYSPGTLSNKLSDTNGDGTPDCTDDDDDGDGVIDTADNCSTTPNPDQADSDANGIGNACEPRAITVPWLGAPAQPHQVYSGGQLILQGTVRMDPSFTITAASWDPGDGSGPVALAAPFNPRALERVHTYAGTDGTPYTATLNATVTNGSITLTLTDTFRVIVRNKTLDVEANMAIDRGLWYLHKTVTPSTSAGGTASGSWSSGHPMAATASALQALQINGHRQTGNRDEDPYVDDVARGLTYLLENLAPVAIAVQTAGDPDTNGNGIGLTLSTAASAPEGYIIGQVVDALVATGTQTTVAAIGHATAVKGRTYRDIVQDLMDSYYWGQADASHGSHRGGWWYDLNAGADTSAAQWGAIGGLAAQTWGIPVPAFVKSELMLWVDQSSFFDGSNAGIDGRFDYDGGNGSGSIFSQSAAEAPSGLIEMVFGGLSSASAQFKATERYISRLFYSSNVWLNEKHIYGMFALAKGFRLASPAITTLDAGGNATPLQPFDWYRSEPVGGAPMGVARVLINSQQANGRWDAGQWVTDHLSTAWGVIILSPTIFALGPTAACDVEPATTGIGGVVSFDAAESFHGDPGGAIASYSWNFADGQTAAGQTTTHAFGATGTYNVILTVTDGNGLTDTESCTVNVIAGALPPNANPGAPYSVCGGQTSVTLNGSASTDPDGTIVSYEWDWTAPLNFATVDATGATPDASVFASMAPGSYDVALRVTDNNGTTDTDFTTVTVKPADDPSCNVGPSFTPPADITTLATSAAGAAVTFTATGTDPEDGTIDAVCSPASGTTFPLGTTTVDCTVTDSQNASASGAFTVTVTNNAPTFTPPADITTLATSAAGAAVTFSATGSDTEDGALAAACSPASGATFPIGTTAVNCTVTDSQNASASGAFTVTVTNNAPTFTPPTDITTLATSGAGAAVTFSATGSDTEDGALAAACSPASGATFPIGTTTVNCTVTDSKGASASGAFTVTVTNNAPTFTPPADITTLATSAAGALATFSATGSDTEDGALAAACSPASGTTFPIGTTTVNCTVTDSKDASASGTFTVTVTNNAPTFTPPADITTLATSGAGAAVTFSATGSDTEDGTIAAVCSPASGATFAVGTTAVNCTVTDSKGATTSGAFTVTVTNNAPTFTPPADITMVATSAAGAAVSFTAVGQDIEDGAIPAVCAPASGSTFPVGTTTVNCTVTDSRNASASGSFTITVTPANAAPVCSAATPSISEIFPANHKLIGISILGVTDPEGGTITLAVTSIFQDEPTNTTGTGNTPIDGYGVGTANPQVRAERAGNGNGRVYHISFSATDGQGASCTGTVKVAVPHDQGKKKVAIDGGPLFKSSGS